MSLHPRNLRAPRLTRTVQNAVSGELETTILDRVQCAYERIMGVFDGFVMAQGDVPDMTAPERDLLIEKLTVALLRARPCGYTDSENTELGLLRKLVSGMADRIHAAHEVIARNAERKK